MSSNLDQRNYITCCDPNVKIVSFTFSELIVIESNKNQIIIHTTHGSYTTNSTLTNAEATLAETDEFIRIHRSFIVAKRFIKKISAFSVEMIDGTHVKIGDNYRKALNDYIKSKMFRF